MDTQFSYIVFAAALIFVIGILVRNIARKFSADSDKWTRMLFIVPQSLINPLANRTEHEITLSGELFKRLYEMRIPFGMEAVVQSLGEEIYFYLVVRRPDVKKVHALVESLWKSGYLNEEADYDLWVDAVSKDRGTLGGYLMLEKPYSVPLQTAHRGHFEPFLDVLKRLSTLAAIGEGAALQVVVRRADQNAAASVGHYLEKLESGNYHPSKHIHEELTVTPETLKRIRSKVHAPLFAINYRIVTTVSRGDARRVFTHIADHLADRSSHPAQQYNNLKTVIPPDQKTLLNHFTQCTFDPGFEIIVNADELATYFHLPGPTTAAHKIKR